MKKKIFISFLLFISISISAQINYEQKLIDMIVTDKWFEANGFYKTYKDSLQYEPIILAYQGGINKVFNHPKEAISYYNDCVEKYASEMHPILLINYIYNPLKEACAEIREFDNANEIINKIIQLIEKDPSLAGTEENLLRVIENYRMAQQLNNLYSTFSPVKVRYDESRQTKVALNDTLKNLLMCNILANDIPLNALFDTGATECLISKRIANKLGIKSSFVDTLKLNNHEQIKGTLGLIDSLQIGTVKIYNLPVYINETEHEAMEMGIKETATEEEKKESKQKIDFFFSSTDIIIGLSVLKRLGEMEWNPKSQTLSFRENSKSQNIEPNLCFINSGLYLKFYLNDNPYYYTALFDTGGDHGLIINRDFYYENSDLFKATRIDHLKKRAMHGFAFHLDYYYLNPERFDLLIGTKSLSLKNNCMISENQLSEINDENRPNEKLAIGIPAFNNNKIAIDFNNMYLKVW